MHFNINYNLAINKKGIYIYKNKSLVGVIFYKHGSSYKTSNTCRNTFYDFILSLQCLSNYRNQNPLR